MDKIYNSSKDVNVAVVKIYASSNKACADSEGKVQLTTDELVDAFVQGAVIVDAKGAYYKPVACQVASKIATVTYVTADSSTSTTAVLATVKSVANAE